MEQITPILCLSKIFLQFGSYSLHQENKIKTIDLFCFDLIFFTQKERREKKKKNRTINPKRPGSPTGLVLRKATTPSSSAHIARLWSLMVKFIMHIYHVGASQNFGFFYFFLFFTIIEQLHQ